MEKVVQLILGSEKRSSSFTKKKKIYFYIQFNYRNYRTFTPSAKSELNRKRAANKSWLYDPDNTDRPGTFLIDFWFVACGLSYQGTIRAFRHFWLLLICSRITKAITRVLPVWVFW